MEDTHIGQSLYGRIPIAIPHLPQGDIPSSWVWVLLFLFIIDSIWAIITLRISFVNVDRDTPKYRESLL